MTLYHGSLEIVEKPQILQANRPLDFGTGFYTTTSLQQARRWVKLRMEQSQASVGFINIYEYTPKRDLRTRLFRSANEAWVDFVHANRTIQDYNHDYDIVTGPVANDKVFTVVNLYESGVLDAPAAIAELRAYKTYNQLSFHTQRVIDALRYVESYEVKE